MTGTTSTTQIFRGGNSFAARLHLRPAVKITSESHNDLLLPPDGGDMVLSILYTPFTFSIEEDAELFSRWFSEELFKEGKVLKALYLYLLFHRGLVSFQEKLDSCGIVMAQWQGQLYGYRWNSTH